MDTQRIIKGFEYFWNLKPSQVRPIHIIYLHEWQKLIKEAIQPDPAKPLTNEELAEHLPRVFR